MFRGLGELYITDEGFTQNIDNVKPGLAGFMSKAIKVYCDRVKK
ncbi:TipAS antibiotic-recognition domain-containing protein [Caloramator australicus]